MSLKTEVSTVISDEIMIIIPAKENLSSFPIKA